MRSVATNTLPQEMSERSGDVFPAKSFFEYFFCSQKKYSEIRFKKVETGYAPSLLITIH